MNTIVCHFGYAENARISPIFFCSKKQFKSVKDMLKSLAQDLWMKFREYSYYKKVELNEDNFYNYLRSLPEKSYDLYGEFEEIVLDDEHYYFSWSPSSWEGLEAFSKRNFLIVWEYIETIVSYLLSFNHPDIFVWNDPEETNLIKEEIDEIINNYGKICIPS